MDRRYLLGLRRMLRILLAMGSVSWSVDQRLLLNSVLHPTPHYFLAAQRVPFRGKASASMRMHCCAQTERTKMQVRLKEGVGESCLDNKRKRPPA